FQNDEYPFSGAGHAERRGPPDLTDAVDLDACRPRDRDLVVRVLRLLLQLLLNEKDVVIRELLDRGVADFFILAGRKGEYEHDVRMLQRFEEKAAFTSVARLGLLFHTVQRFGKLDRARAPARTFGTGEEVRVGKPVLIDRRPEYLFRSFLTYDRFPAHSERVPDAEMEDAGLDGFSPELLVKDRLMAGHSLRIVYPHPEIDPEGAKD